jgi:predicted PhzF superfamily epimerase YddE/YHI9
MKHEYAGLDSGELQVKKKEISDTLVPLDHIELLTAITPIPANIAALSRTRASAYFIHLFAFPSVKNKHSPKARAFGFVGALAVFVSSAQEREPK